MPQQRHPGESRDPREPPVDFVDSGFRRDHMRGAAPQIVELRQYTLHPGRRDELIALFEREFVHTQEAAGIAVMGTFRDLDGPDRFVWLRGFADMRSRADALQRFYGGPAWRAHSEQANATMADSDDVLLLKPVPALRSTASRPGVAVAAVIPAHGTPAASALAAFEAVGARPFAAYETEPAPNNFPRLPVRDNESVIVVLASPPASPADTDGLRLQQVLRARLPRGTQVLRLSPTTHHHQGTTT